MPAQAGNADQIGISNRAIVVILFLVSCAVCLATAPLVARAQPSTSDITAKPKPTPVRVLDAQAVSALIDDLKADLQDAVDDEAAVSSITEKWKAKNLVGKTRKQAIEILLADVRSVVKDAEITKKLSDSWKALEADSEEPDMEPEPKPTPAPMTTPVPVESPEPEATPKPVDKNPPDNPGTEEMIEVEPPPLSDVEMKAVMEWVGVKVGALRLPFCWRRSYGNTAGEPYTCKPGLERIGLLCYPTCKQGYHKSTANLCTTDCPAGFTDIGAFCQKPGPYGRGAGYVPYMCGRFAACKPGSTPAYVCEQTEGKGNCEQWGAFWYPKCKPGFHNVGANICSPDCPAGWADTGTGCTKPIYGIGAGEGLDLGKCRPGLEKDPAGALCYPTCQKDFHMVGPVCWQNCPAQQSFDCGAGCTTNQGECAKGVFDQVFSPIMAAITLATWGRTSAIGAAAKVAKVASSAGRLTKAFEAVKGVLAVAKGSLEKAVGGAENFAKLQQTLKIGGRLYKAGSAIGKEVDHFSKEFADNFEDNTSPEIAAEIDKRFGPQGAYAIKRQWGLNILYTRLDADGFATAKNIMVLVSAADPTGLVGVAEAFMHPMCGVNTPFPTVHPLYNR